MPEYRECCNRFYDSRTQQIHKGPAVGVAAGVGELQGAERPEDPQHGSRRPVLPHPIQSHKGHLLHRRHVSGGHCGEKMLPLQGKPSAGAVPSQVRGTQGEALQHTGESVSHIPETPGHSPRRTYSPGDMAPFSGHAGLHHALSRLSGVLQRSGKRGVGSRPPALPGHTEASSSPGGGRGRLS